MQLTLRDIIHNSKQKIMIFEKSKQTSACGANKENMHENTCFMKLFNIRKKKNKEIKSPFTMKNGNWNEAMESQNHHCRVDPPDTVRSLSIVADSPVCA
ncbi:hypothetical protein T12_10874 [Trichinella patagoniensis]|nr:hypothetical protein T12_10874 [Trichinella patagoniensis]